MKFPSKIDRDWIEILASFSCIVSFLAVSGVILWTEVSGVILKDKSLLMLIIGFCIREVGALSIGRENGKYDNGNGNGSIPTAKG